MKRACLLFFLFLAPTVAAPATLPFVGCPSDGQQGAEPAPAGKPLAVDLASAIAAKLAVYQSRYDDGILAPRGWHCLNLEGSSGAFTIVSPQPLSADDFIGSHPKSLTGPAIQISISNGGTSGRFEVARLIARYFPDRHAFLDGVIAEGIESAKDFPRGPFKDDRLVSRRRDIVEVVTPPGREGLGTMSRLAASDRPIHAVASVRGGVDDDWIGYSVAVRLSADQDDLAPFILKWAEGRYLVKPPR